MTDHTACIAQLEALNAEHNRTVHELRRVVDTLADARVLAQRLQRNGPGTVDGEYGEVAALLDLLLSVPVGGGEPQPTTSTDNEPPCLDPHCLLDSDHKGECEQEPSDVRNGIEGGDQPDTPCPHCGGSGIKRGPNGGPSLENGTPLPVPCPACAPVVGEAHGA